jgi:NitT/TauT family transport system substrate-binding protein
VTQHSDSGSVFEAKKFQDFPTMKEALISRNIDATFMIMPLAMKLVSDGVPVKIVYLGHRDGSTLMVRTDSDIKDFEGLKGKTVAIPSRYSNQQILMLRTMKERGMKEGDIIFKELPPPEHPSALFARSIDAYIIGEPHAAKAEMEGYGRVLYRAGDLWPNFISCGLVVRQEVIEKNRAMVEELVRGVASSGKWLDSDLTTGAQHRHDAAIVAGKVFYNQPPALLDFVLTKDLQRVKYTDLKPPKERFDEMMDLFVEFKLMPRKMNFEEYCDTSFAPDLETITPPFDRLPDVDKVAQQK